MNIYIFLLALTHLSYFIGIDHDIQVSTFTVYQRPSDKIKLDVVMEIDDLSDELKTTADQLTPNLLETYLNSQTAFKFNGSGKMLRVNAVAVKAKHLIIQSEFEGAVHSVHTLEIQNTCLLGVEDQSNIIEIRLNDQERDFLMNSSRKKIKIEW